MYESIKKGEEKWYSRYFNSRIGKASNPNENIGKHGQVTKNKNGAETLGFLESNESNEMKTLNDRVKKVRPE